MARGRHHNGQYTRGNGSPGDGTGLSKVYTCDQPEHLFGATLEAPQGRAEDDVDPHHVQDYADNHETPCHPLKRNSPPHSLRRSK